MSHAKELHTLARSAVLLKYIAEGRLKVAMLPNKKGVPFEDVMLVNQGVQNGFFYHYALNEFTEYLGSIIKQKLTKEDRDAIRSALKELSNAGLNITIDGFFLAEHECTTDVCTNDTELNMILIPVLNDMLKDSNKELSMAVVSTYDNLYMIEKSYIEAVKLLYMYSGNELDKYRDRYDEDFDKDVKTVIHCIFTHCLQKIQQIILQDSVKKLMSLCDTNVAAQYFTNALNNRVSTMLSVLKVVLVDDFEGENYADIVPDENDYKRFNNVLTLCQTYNVPDSELLEYLDIYNRTKNLSDNLFNMLGRLFADADIGDITENEEGVDANLDFDPNVDYEELALNDENDSDNNN